jgi:hypothetical protein
MQYLLLIYDAPGAAGGEVSTEDGVFADWVTYTRGLRSSGALLAGEYLNDPETATTVRLRAGERLLTDGPFIETNEHLVGFYLVDVDGLDQAIDWAARMPMIRHGTVEVRPVRPSPASARAAAE